VTEARFLLFPVTYTSRLTEPNLMCRDYAPFVKRVLPLMCSASQRCDTVAFFATRWRCWLTFQRPACRSVSALVIWSQAF